MPIFPTVPAIKGTLVVVNQRSDSAYLIRLRDGKVVHRIPTGHGPHEAAVSPNGKTAIVTNYEDAKPSLLVIDVPSGQVVKTIALGEYTHPHGIAFLNDRQAICTSETTKRLALVDVAEGTVIRPLATDRPGSHLFVLTKDGKFAFSANVPASSVSKVDVATGKFLGEAKVGRGSEGIGISPDGTQVWVANRVDATISVVDTATMTVKETIPDPGLPYRVAFTPNGRYALVANPVAGSLDVFDSAKRTLAKKIDAAKSKVEFAAQGGPPAIGGIAVHPGGKFVFCTAINAEAVALIDLDKGEVVAKYEAGVSPDGVAFSPVETTG